MENILIIYMYMLQNDYHDEVKVFIFSDNYDFVCVCVIAFNIYCLKNFHVYNIVLLIRVPCYTLEIQILFIYSWEFVLFHQYIPRYPTPSHW